MSGTISEKELRINCGSKLCAQVPDEKNASAYNNAAAMAIVGNTMYWVKTHKRVNSQNVYKSTVYKAADFTGTAEISRVVVKVIDYFVYGMTVKGNILYLTCKKSSTESGVLAMDLNGNIRSYTPLDKTYVGIASYVGSEFLMMEYLDSKVPAILKFARGTLAEFGQNEQRKFTVTANDATEYTKANGIYFDVNYGIFILANHYISDYSQCKNRILLVRAADYKANTVYSPYAVFQADFDATKYRQFNFEGIALYKNNMWELSNVIGTGNNTIDTDRVTYQAGVTFTKVDSGKNEFENGYFYFKGATKTGALIPDEVVDNIQCKNLESMAIDESGKAYCLKCDSQNEHAVLMSTSNLESIRATKVAVYKDKDCLYHCNGMMYNSNDKHLYICGYDKSDKNNIKKNIYVVDKNGKVLKIYDSGKPQYGIALYKKETSRCEILLMNQKVYDERENADNTIPFDIAIFENTTMNIVQNAFKLEFGRKTGETLQDIFYNSIYGMFVPVTSFNGLKNKAIIFHISKEQIEYALKQGGVVRPDFAILLDKSETYKNYEIESMDIISGKKQMAICGNFQVKNEVQKDTFEVLKTLIFE